MKIFSYDLCPNWQEKVVCRLKNNKLVRRVDLIDLNTKLRYKCMDVFSVARKAFFIFLYNPIFLFLKIAFNVFQMAFDYVKVTIDSSVDTAIALKNMNLLKIVKIFIKSKIDFLKYVIEDIISIARSIFYAFAMQLASFFTIFCPSTGRKIIADIERSWNYNKSLAHDYRFNKEMQNKPIYKILWDILFNRDENTVFYLNPCFQPLEESLENKNIVSYSG